MLEYFVLKGKNRYLKTFIYSLIISLILIYISYRYVNFYNSLMAVILISLSLAYPFTRILKGEESLEERFIRKIGEHNILIKHFREILIYLLIFLSISFSFVIASKFLPNSFFSPQINTIKSITGGLTSKEAFIIIFQNNLRVFLVTFLISLIVSAGMILVLVWNASVFGVFLYKETLSLIQSPLLALFYLPHGIFEISAYIIAGLSGSLISHEFEHINNINYRKHIIPYVILDALILLAIGFILILAGAVIEVL